MLDCITRDIPKSIKNIIDNMDCNEIASRLYDHAADRDNTDYENKNKDIEDIENALYQIKAIAQNPYNSDYYRTFVLALIYAYQEL